MHDAMQVAILVLIALVAVLMLLQGGWLMALSDEVKAFRDEVGPQLDSLASGIDAATEDILKIQDLLSNSGGGPDVPGAQAALAELRAKFAIVAEVSARLAEAVAIPEGEDPPPPPIEE